MFNYHEILLMCDNFLCLYSQMCELELFFLICTQLNLPTKRKYIDFPRFRLLHKQTFFMKLENDWQFQFDDDDGGGSNGCGKSLIEFACSLITDVRNNHEEVKILHEINFDMHCCSLNIGIEWLKRKVFSQFNGILIALSQTCKSLINFHCRWHIFIIKLL